MFGRRVSRWLVARALLPALATAGVTEAQCADQGRVLFENVGSDAGKPFAAERITTRVTIRDGARQTTLLKEKIFRDREGRVRVERYFPSEEATPSQILIDDPCTQTATLLLPRQRAAKVSKMIQAKGAAPFCDDLSPDTAPKPPPNEKFEDLGHRMIAGVRARGTRETTYDSEKEKEAGGSPARQVEMWCSREFRSLVEFHEQTRNGSEVRTVMNNVLEGDPDPKLFAVPEDYAVTPAESSLRVRSRRQAQA